MATNKKYYFYHDKTGETDSVLATDSAHAWNRLEGFVGQQNLYQFTLDRVETPGKKSNPMNKTGKTRKVQRGRKKVTRKKTTSKKSTTQKNTWIYNKGMSDVTKAPTYVNKNKRGNYAVKVTSKKRIAYFPTMSDWDYSKNYKVFKR